MDRPEEWCMTPCPVCGVMFSDKVVGTTENSELTIHVGMAHAVGGEVCFCKASGNRLRWQVRKHIVAHGGYQQHYTDYLLGGKFDE